MEVRGGIALPVPVSIGQKELSESQSNCSPPAHIISHSSKLNSTCFTMLDLFIYYHNVGGISSATQLRNMRAALYDCPYNIVVLVETWFKNGIKSSELFDEREWIVLRCDRCDTGSSKDGGGVLIAIRTTLVATKVILDSGSNEEVWSEIKLGDRSIYVGAVYLPPNTTRNDRKLALKQVVKGVETVSSKMKSCDSMLYFGDFNYVVEWVPDSENHLLQRPIDNSNPESHEGGVDDEEFFFFDALAEHGLAQINNIKCRNQLDLVFTDLDCDFSVSRARHPLKCDSVHHAATSISVSIKSQLPDEDPDELNFDFNKANIPGMTAALDMVNWEHEFCNKDIDAQVGRFYEIIDTVIRQNVPKRCPQRKYTRPWMNRVLAGCRNRRNRAFRAYQRYPSNGNLSRFLMYRDSFLKLDADAYRSYLSSQADLLKKNPAKFWRMIKSGRSTGGIPRLMRYNNIETTNAKATSDLFASFFKTVYSGRTPEQLPQGPSMENLCSYQLSTSDVFKALQELDVSKGCGPDGIPNRLLKPLSNVLSHPLVLLFNCSIATGTFPSVWKRSFVTPIFKSGDRSECSNYRSISILSAIPKLFEKLVCHRLEEDLGHFISAAQHGFRSGRSTSTNLALYTENVLNMMLRHGQVDSLYTDFAKAFDRVCHRLLLRKLSLLGVGGALLNWLASYLSDRSHLVRVGSRVSQPYFSSSGVPQGSHLGPLLFALFVNDICDVIVESEFLLYADDLKIYKPMRTPEDADCLQRDLQRINSWCSRNGMELNVTKCQAISFSRKQSTTSCTINWMAKLFNVSQQLRISVSSSIAK